MKFLLVAICLLWQFTPSVEKCSTTVTVTNCKGERVSSARITIKTCHDSKEHIFTSDSNGEVACSICEEDICTMDVTARVASRVITGIRENCHGDKTNYRCTIRLCDKN